MIKSTEIVSPLFSCDFIAVANILLNFTNGIDRLYNCRYNNFLCNSGTDLFLKNIFVFIIDLL